jgi:hypothetical protein
MEEVKDKTLGLRKAIGYILLIFVLYIGGASLKEVPAIFDTFAKYVFYGFFVFVGGNAIEYLKIIAEHFKKQ